MIHAHAKNADAVGAVRVLEQMKDREISPDVFSRGNIWRTKFSGIQRDAGKKSVYRPSKKKLSQIWMKMQTPILPKFEISVFGKFGFPKNQKSPPQNQFGG